MKKTSRILGAALFVGLSALPASAGTLTFQLDYIFSGTVPPAATGPWVQATFEDVSGGVQLTITATNLTGGEFISDFYFNFNPSLGASSYLPSPQGTGTQTAFNSMAAGNNCCKADGDGYFDFNIDFPPPGSDRFTNGETFVVKIAGSTLTTADFNYVSVDGPTGATGFYAAAHVQGIALPAGGTTSVWIAPSPVPEPGTLLLLGAGLTGLASVRRRRSR